MLDKIEDLDNLWKFVYKINRENFPENELVPICGNGKLFKPKVMFVFINPTHVNSSSDKNWKGPKFPFVGTKPFWKVLYNSEILDKELFEKINNSKEWSVELTEEVLKFIEDSSLYLTNVVKYTGRDATLPDSGKINMFLPILKKEIQIVKPKYIVAFGLIPFKGLVKQNLKLSDYHSESVNSGKLRFYEEDFNGVKVKIIPNYFPVGLGNPKKSAEILRMVNDLD